MINFEESTHKHFWTFSRETLAQKLAAKEPITL